MTRDEERIRDILDAIARIEEAISAGRQQFERSHVIQAAVLYNIQIIGEAASGMTDEAHAVYPGIPWRSIVAMRNRIVHRYFDIDLELVWNAATRDLIQLRDTLRSG